MMNDLKFALYALKKNIQSSAELRTSFLLNIFGMSINNTAFILLWGFFVKSVGVIGGWTAVDIIGLQGFVALSFGIVFSCADGIRRLADSTASGSFDRFMLSPKNLLVRIATSSFGVSAVGDILFGVVCLSIYAILIHATFFQIILILLLAIVSSIVFLAANILIYSTCFYFTDAHSVTSSLAELFLTPSLFHGGAFQGWMRFVFTFVVPSLLVGAIPVEIVRSVSWQTLLFSSLLAICWFVLSVFVFYRAIRKYESSNFMTFGS